MNPRVLELLKNPKNIQSEDLHLLKEEINSFPYIQNIRALHLYGVHLYDKENYQKELTTTAAYTTDKKILYQLINGKIQEKPKPQIIEEKEPEINKNTFRYIYQTSSFPIKRIEPEKKEEVSHILPTPQPEIKPVYINGERNRILFEGEENFLNEENTEIIDLESTLESGTLVTQKQEKPENIEETAEFTPETIIEEENITSKEETDEIKNTAEESFHEVEAFMPEINIEGTEEINKSEITSENKTEETEFTPEEIINEDKTSSQTVKEEVTDGSELSFHGMESFMPDVKIQPNNNADEFIKTEVSQPNVNKHEEEMRRLIEEVERKMKANKEPSVNKKQEPEAISHEISFAETQSFHIEPVEQKTEKITEEQSVPEEIKPENTESSEEKEPVKEVVSAWRPMNVESNIPDSLINKKTEISQEKIEIPKEEKAPKQEEILPETKELPELTEDKSEKFQKSEELQEDLQIEEGSQSEAPVMNVSFFSSDISNWGAEPKKEEERIKEIKEKPAEEINQNTTPDSNIPGFINTWQNWLKIDRTEEVEKEKTESKIKAIDNFIENNPKISQLKDESSYVVKEKTDDISHLMTETLANLYFEQKLYTKAIKAFEILISKNPEKKDYFESKIQEIKDFRTKN